MKELSLHILDIVENSIRAKATEINIEINEDLKNNIFSFKIKDNGIGMDADFIKNVRSPFKTTRTTRKVGLGIPLLDSAAKRCNGKLEVKSHVGKGTEIIVFMEYNHIDRAPLGDIASTISNLILSNPQIEFTYVHKYNNKSFNIDTKEIKKILGEISISDLSVIKWIKEYINKSLIKIRQTFDI
ncbi:ATP-binding protein [Defluviitalea phaphyphila]|uniref:ATP-binding protein n=1 Tax=Defluviitalea phaphyphila TaxID=1473580 RepID=UPI000730169B|nr:ATP-binding protein [Defluviitalea phaphyphila]